MDRPNQIKHIAEQLIGQGNMDIVDASFSDNYVAHAGDTTHKGPKFVKQFTHQVRVAIPDIKLVNIEVLAQTENIVTWQRILSGTHKADLLGIPASNKKVKWYEIVVTLFDHDKIAEEWFFSDLAFQLMLKLK